MLVVDNHGITLYWTRGTRAAPSTQGFNDCATSLVEHEEATGEVLDAVYASLLPDPYTHFGGQRSSPPAFGFG